MARIVLIADDSPTIQKRAMGILKGEGFEVETVSNGVAAIKRLAVLRPVVVLADVSMPGRDGYEVCDFVKKSPELSQVPVLLVASDMEPYDSARGASVKADGIIKKPFEARELISAVVKFAEQFEATTISIADVSIAPTSRTEPEREFSLGGDGEDNAPTIVQHAAPDFSHQVGGVAFAVPSSEEPQAFSIEAPSDRSEGAFAAPHNDASPFGESAFAIPSPQNNEYPRVAETPLETSPFASPAHDDADKIPSFMEHLAGAPPEPVFTDEHPGHAPTPSEIPVAMRTAIFHTSLEIGAPGWKDAPAPPSVNPESSDLGAPEPQFITEESEGSSEAPLEHPHVHPHEHQHTHNSLGATSLDSFSLDDAAAGQVRFASELPEVVYAAPREETAALELAAPEQAPEVIRAEAASADGGTVPEVVYADPAPPEVAPEVVYAEPATIESAPQAYIEAAPPEAGKESVNSEIASPDATVEAVRAEAAVPEIAPETLANEVTSGEPVSEAVRTEVSPAEPTPEEAPFEHHLPVAAPVAALAGIASLGAAVEAIHAGIDHHESEAELAASGLVKTDSSNETIHTTEPPAEILAEAESEPLPKPISPHPAIDADMLYTIILKVVMKMAPPMLTEEAVAQIARHLAQEIATEISLESPKPPAS